MAIPKAPLPLARSIPSISLHNSNLILQYYQNSQNKFYKEIIHAHHPEDQQGDTRFVTPLIIIPLLLIHTNECNPENDITTTTPTTNIDGENAHIYEDNGRHLFSIPTSRLQWLWKQYHNSLQIPNYIEPSTQSFETELVWLYQRYKYRSQKMTPSNSPIYSPFTNPRPPNRHL